MQTRVGSGDPFEDGGAGLGSSGCSRTLPRSSAPWVCGPRLGPPQGPSSGGIPKNKTCKSRGSSGPSWRRRLQ